MRNSWAVVLLCLTMSWLAALPAWGQVGPAAPAESEALQQLRATGQPLSEAAVRDLVARLDDAEVRQLLLEQLDARAVREAPAAAGVEKVLADLRVDAETLREAFVNLILAFPAIPDGIAPAMTRMMRDDSGEGRWLLALGFALMLLAGWGLERLLRWRLRARGRGSSAAESGASLAGFGNMLLRLSVDLFYLAVFLAGALAVFFILWHGSELSRNVVMTYLAAVVMVRIVASISDALLAPEDPPARMPQIGDRDARYLHRQVILLAAIAAFGFLTCGLLEQLGTPLDVHTALVFLVGVALVGTAVFTIWRGRGAITGDLAWDRAQNSSIRIVIADAWPGFMAVLVVVIYLAVVAVSLIGGEASFLTFFGSLFAVLLVPHIDAGLERASLKLEAEKEMAEHVSGQILIVGLRAARILLYIGSGLFLLRIWGVNLFALAEQSVGSRIAEALLDIGLTALIAYVLWEMARIAIDRRLAEEGAGAEGEGAVELGDMGGEGVSRIRTLLPLLRGTIQVTIIVMGVMLVLSSLGVNIGPLLAGAGVIGLAVGFGAQTLVRDIVSGVFFLVDDAFRLGEYIDVGSVKGTVEKISIRSLRLRHHRGALHTIPFGEIQHLTNYGRDWAIMKLQFRVPFDTDLEKVRKIFKKIGQDLMQDEEIGPDFIQPFKSQGVLETDDSAFVIRGKFMAKPGKQFLIRRAVFQAVQKAFAEQGIRFADRRVTVNVPGAEHMEPEERAAAEKAAASAVAAAEAQAQGEAQPAKP